ncbi:MAG: tetratricopeptide repeat protein [Candidatus Eisenbacteria bacterium]
MPEISRRDRRLLFLIVLIALAIRVAYLIDIRDSPYFEYPVLDSFWYDAKAEDVLAGDTLASSGSFRVPLYTYFIAACYSVFGHGFMAPLVIQAMLGALTCGLCFLIARRLFGRLAGVVAGLGFALYRMAVYSDGELLPTTLFMFFMLVAVYFILAGIRARPVSNGVLTGLFLGLAFLTRPDILPFAVVTVAVILVLVGFAKGVRFVVPMCALLVALMLLLGCRNHLAFGEFHVFSPQGAVNFYIGNAGFADGKTPVAPLTRYPYQVAADPSEDSITLACKQAAAEEVGRVLTDRELSRYYVLKTFGEIGDDFPRWLGLVSKKVYYFLNTYERSDIKLIPRFVQRHSAVLRLPLIPYAVVMPLGVVGMGLAILRRRRRVWIITAGLLAFAANALIFFVIWRYRLPAVPFLAILAGYAVTETCVALRERAFRTVIVMLGAALVLGLISVSSLWRVAEEDWTSQYIANEGALFMKAERYEEATELYKEAIEAEPSNPASYFYLGKAYATRGLIDESKEMMEKAVMLSAGYEPFAHQTLGVAFANSGDFASAVAEFEKALAADGELGLAAFNLGLCNMSLGNYEEAEKAFTRAEFLCKDDSGVLVAIARAFVNMGRQERGIRLAQTVLRDDPHNPEALYTVGLGLEGQGRVPEAIVYFERALRFLPSAQEIRQKIIDLKRRQSMQ